MSDPFDRALSEAAQEEVQKKQRLKAAQEQREREERDRRAKRMTAFEVMRDRIATKDEALQSFSFVRGEAIDEDRNDYRVILSNGNKMIAAHPAKKGVGYHVYVWWSHVTNDGFIEPIDTADPETLDDLMATLGGWVARHGTPKDK